MHLKFLVSFKVKALNQTQIFEKLRQKGVEFFDIKLLNRFETAFSVNRKDKKIVESVLENFQAETLSLKPKSLSKINAFFVHKIGIVAGILCAFFLQVFSSFFVLQINVSGASCAEEIKSYIESQGIKSFCPKSVIDTENLELGIIENFPEISMASVIVKGLSVVVNVKEKESFEEISQTDIVANFNGRIKEIITISGTALVKAGDIVKFGDVLVSAESENSENGVVAKAKIVAEVWYESTHTHIETQTQKVRTGNFIQKRQVFAFGAQIFSSNMTCDFLDYEVEEDSIKINTILPLEVKNFEYYETVEKTTTIPYSEVKDNIISSLKENALQKMAKDDIIQKENVFETAEAGITTTTYVIIAEKRIF